MIKIDIPADNAEHVITFIQSKNKTQIGLIWGKKSWELNTYSMVSNNRVGTLIYL